MKNKRVGTKMMISSGISLLLTLLLIVLSIRNITSTRNSYQDILNNQVSVTNAVLESEMEVNSIARQLRDMALFGYNTSTMSEINDSVNIITSTLQTIDTLNSDLANQYIQQVEDWEAAFGDISQALQTGDSAKVSQLLQNQCTPKLNQAVTTGQSLIQELNSQTDALTRQLQSQTTLEIVILVVLVVICILASISLNLLNFQPQTLPRIKQLPLL